MAEVLSMEDYVKIVQEKYRRNDIKIISTALLPVTNYDGFMGEYYTLKITSKTDEKDHEDNFFVKTIPRKNQFQNSIATEHSIYLKEIFFYNTMMKDFEKNNYRTDFTPKSYLCKDDSTIVLQDIKSEGYRMLPKGKFFDHDHIKALLRCLAYLHANTISLEETKSKSLGKPFRFILQHPDYFKENFLIPNDNEGLGAKFINSSKTCLKQICMLKPEEDWTGFFERLDNFDIGTVFSQDLPYRKTCCHGDLWSNNMMFRYTDGVECCFYDFQVLRYHHPGFDVMLALYLNTKKDFRKNHMDELKKYYYDFFSEVLISNGLNPCDILSEDEFLGSCEVMTPVAVMQSCAMRTCLVFPVEFTNDVVKSDDMMEKLMFEDRSEYLKKFLDDEEVKNVLFDYIEDLKECI